MEKVKKDFRKEMRLKRAHFFLETPQELQQEWAASLWEQVQQHPAFIQAHTVLLYSALPDEVPTETFIARWADKKQILLPVVCGDTLILRRYDPNALQNGYQGVLEPNALCEEWTPQDVDFAVVPGLAFTPDGQRMGRGKGYYDRLIPQLTHAVKVSVAFPFQLCEQIPQDPWDERVDVVYQAKPLSDTKY